MKILPQTFNSKIEIFKPLSDKQQAMLPTTNDSFISNFPATEKLLDNSFSENHILKAITLRSRINGEGGSNKQGGGNLCKI